MNLPKLEYLPPAMLAAAVLVMSACGGSGSSASSPPPPPAATYALNLDPPALGAISFQPELAEYPAGSAVTLTATAADGHAFSSWSGSLSGSQNPVTLIMDGNKSIGAHFVQVNTDDYYVDYENGDDNNDGRTPTTAWQHAPGDANATGTARSESLGPGARLLFKGGTHYRGQIKVPVDGALGFPVTYQGNAWPIGQMAIIDGGDLVSGWTACSPDVCSGYSDGLWYAYINAVVDPLGLNLHEYDSATSTDEFAWQAQTPNPADFYFYDNHDYFIEINSAAYTNPVNPSLGILTLTSLTDATTFQQPDAEYWKDSYLLIWTNPNTVVTRKITSYDPATHTVTFDSLNSNALYSDRPQAYAIFNSPHAIDQPGEYHAAVTADNRTKIILKPFVSTNLANRISYSVRNWGFDLNNRSNITIEGFSIIKHAGYALRDGIGIGTITSTAATNYNLVIKNNSIKHNRKGGGGGYGGIYLSKSANTLVEGNEVVDNPQNAGIFFSGGSDITVRNNLIERSGATSLRLYTVNNAVLDHNEIRKSQGNHANGITIYMGSQNILIANNLVSDSDSPITFQDSGNLWYINNIIDARDRVYNVNEWPDTSRGPWARGTIAFLNNTLLRNTKDASLSFGRNTTEKVVDLTVYPANTYISKNNIIDGGGGVPERGHNLYVGIAWNQQPLLASEVEQRDLSLIFTNPDGYDYHLRADSPALDAGTDIDAYLPTSLFPNFTFGRDFEGTVRSRTTPDLGAYELP